MRQLLLPAVIACLLESCSKAKKDDNSAPSPEKITQDQTSFSKDLIGSWVSEKCETFPGETTSRKSFLKFEASGIVETSSAFYYDIDCVEKMFTGTWTGTYSIKGNSEKIKNSFIVENNLEIEKLAPGSIAMVEEFNTNRYCGFSDWKINDFKVLSSNAGNCELSESAHYRGGSLGPKTDIKTFVLRYNELDLYSETRSAYLETFRR